VGGKEGGEGEDYIRDGCPPRGKLNEASVCAAEGVEGGKRELGKKGIGLELSACLGVRAGWKNLRGGGDEGARLHEVKN